MLSENLTSLIESVMPEGCLDAAYMQAGVMIERGDDLPLTLESELLNFISDKNERTFTALSKEIVIKNLLNDYAENVKLISFLTGKGWLDSRDAALLLSAIPYAERNKLPAIFTRAIEIADLICEDSDDGYMEATDDDILIVALKVISAQGTNTQ